MKARTYKDSPIGINRFDLTADIVPGEGAGGVAFTNTIADFESVCINSLISEKPKTNIFSEVDGKYFYLTLSTQHNEFNVEIDLFSGKIDSMILRKGYMGKLLSGLGIGSKMSELLNADQSIYFDLDHSFYVRQPFDGLIIYPTTKELADDIWNATFRNDKPIPDFKIETIELLNMGFAREHFSDTLMLNLE